MNYQKFSILRMACTLLDNPRQIIFIDNNTFQITDKNGEEHTISFLDLKKDIRDKIIEVTDILTISHPRPKNWHDKLLEKIQDFKILMQITEDEDERQQIRDTMKVVYKEGFGITVSEK